jgi:tetratricopeptide (TPR) repeat protein
MYSTQSRSWLIPGVAAGVLFIGGVASNLVASDLEQKIAPYRPWVYGVCGLALLVSITLAIRESRSEPRGGDAIKAKIELTEGMTAVGKNIQQTIIYEAANRAVPSLHQLPPPPGDFTGRADELAELLNKLETGGISISGLQGQGGVGKTALALKLAEQIKPRYPDAQFYLDLKGTSPQPLSPGDVMAHVIRAYHPTVQLPEAEDALQSIYQSVLDGQRALLLMDNVAERKQIEPLIPPTGCVLLVTSRQHFHLPGLYARNLEVLSLQDSRELLLTIAPRIGDEANEIARLCGYLPLALRLAAGTLAEREEISPADYGRRLKDASQRLKLLDEVEASLNVSFELLSAEQRKRWLALAIFPDSFDTPAAAAIWALETDPAQDALSGLKARSLVEWNRETERYRLHDLARLFAALRLDEAERAITARLHAEYFCRMLSAADDLYQKGDEDLMRGLALYDKERSNIEAGQAWVEAQAQADDELAKLCAGYALNGGYILFLRQHLLEFIRWQEAALGASRHLKQRQNEGAALGNLGIAYRNLVKVHKALEYHKQALDISREIGDREGEGGDLASLGNVYTELGDARKAIEYYEQALVITQEIADRRGEGNALCCLGIVYMRMDDARRAIEYYEQALGIYREIGDKRGEAFDLWNLSLALDSFGQHTEANARAQESLKILEQIEDPNADRVREQLDEWRG